MSNSDLLKWITGLGFAAYAVAYLQMMLGMRRLLQRTEIPNRLKSIVKNRERLQAIINEELPRDIIARAQDVEEWRRSSLQLLGVCIVLFTSLMISAGFK